MQLNEAFKLISDKVGEALEPRGFQQVKADSANDTTATLTYTMTALSDVTLRVFYVGFRFPVGNLIGHEYQLDDDPPQIFPEKNDKTHLARKAVSKLTIGTKFGPIVLRFHKPTKLLLQDDRQWAETFLLRVAPAGEDDKDWKNGDGEALCQASLRELCRNQFCGRAEIQENRG